MKFWTYSNVQPANNTLLEAKSGVLFLQHLLVPKCQNRSIANYSQNDRFPVESTCCDKLTGLGLGKDCGLGLK